ncbi:hypothetical protein ACFODZ_16760 [Marinicella sediminis]|uniref:Uncharacterized protein n=1 Tax=Marinicella sediminis TaxID=1792834 RepID=A0ABV7JI35_9GAMM|nr:hypothetical protein [Marinicella sediminis]
MNIQLTVAYVAFGGNTGQGAYFYSYSPDIIQVTEKDTKMNFVLSDATDERFIINQLVSTDANQQFEPALLEQGKRSIRVMNKNTHSQLTMVSVLVQDTTTGAYISCDPQVLNVPDE